MTRRDRLRAEIRSLASKAVAALGELVSGDPDIPPAVRLRACITVLQAANLLDSDTIGPTSAEGVKSAIRRAEFSEALNSFL
jgi:hypothetical protein